MAQARVDPSGQQLGLVKHILARNGVSSAHQPVLFGSRVTGQARRYGDLDIAVAEDPSSASRIRDLRDDLEESNLSIRVDVLNLAEAHAALRAHASGRRSVRRRRRRLR